ncbi:hypothetical protein M5D96_008041, partial [Drosophila gunungcola]
CSFVLSVDVALISGQELSQFKFLRRFRTRNRKKEFPKQKILYIIATCVFQNIKKVLVK